MEFKILEPETKKYTVADLKPGDYFLDSSGDLYVLGKHTLQYSKWGAPITLRIKDGLLNGHPLCHDITKVELVTSPVFRKKN